MHSFSNFNAGSLGDVKIHISANCNNSPAVAHINIAAIAVLAVIAFDKHGISLCGVKQCSGIYGSVVCHRITVIGSGIQHFICACVESILHNYVVSLLNRFSGLFGIFSRLFDVFIGSFFGIFSLRLLLGCFGFFGVCSGNIVGIVAVSLIFSFACFLAAAVLLL